MISSMSNKCDPEEMNAEDPLFLLYTSGSIETGSWHTIGGYMVYANDINTYLL